MIQRFFSTVVLWLIVTGALFFGKATAGILLLTALVFFTQLEFYQLLKKIGQNPYTVAGLSLGVIMMLGAWYGPMALNVPATDIVIGILALSFSLLSISLLLNPCKAGVPNPLMPTFFGILFIPFCLQFIVQIVVHYAKIGHLTQGIALAIWVVATAKFSDVGGLVIGSTIGKHKMAPIISPSKTWEGAAGGIVFSLSLGAIMHIFGKDYLPAGFSLKEALGFAFPISILAILSDLVQSVFKRQAQTKDSGFFIPGIGGAFDLSDSLILTAPAAYYLLRIFTF